MQTHSRALAMELQRLGCTDAHARRCGRIVLEFGAWLDRRMGRPSEPGDVTPRIAHEWALEDSAAGKGPKTQRNRLSALRVLGDLWVSWGDLQQNPFTAVRLPRRRTPAEGADAMELEQLRALVDAARARERLARRDARARGPLASTLYAFLAHTGLRRGEAAAQRWEDIDLPGAMLTVTLDKSRRKDLLPLSGECVLLLRRWRLWSRGEMLFPAFPSDHTIRADLEAAGVDGRGAWHRLRKTAITLRARDLADWRALVRFARHKDPRMTLKVYDQARAEEARPVAECLRIALPA